MHCKKAFGCFDQAIDPSELQHDNPTMLAEADQLHTNVYNGP